MKKARDHIFISYATEQSALCDWLARRLAAEGYAIWYDRQKLLGGENWPNDIDAAINERTFRMLALLSRASMKKPNPQGEWLKGNAIGKKLGIEDFVIPLNTEGLRPDEITWNLQPINYIPFTPSWAKGLVALLKKLASLDAPQALKNGPKIAVESIVAERAIQDEPEILISNCFEIKQLPRFIRKYKLTVGKLSKDERRALRRDWVCRDVSSRHVFAFDDPPTAVSVRHRFKCVSNVCWRNTELFDGIENRVLVVGLIHKCLHHLLKGRGMTYCESRKQWYLPRGILENDHVTFKFPSGKKSWFKGVGERTYKTGKGAEKYLYHLSPSFEVLYEQADQSVILLRNRIYFTDVQNIPLEERKILSRRKHLCKKWFNNEWCVRILGIAQLLADEDMYIRFGPAGEQQLVINAMPYALNSPQRILDELFDETDEIDTEEDAEAVSENFE